jgi:SARP family transcriptional regulator, regulator of embCAB operon
MPPLEFGVLGPLQMSVQGQLTRAGAPKQRAVLAMLVINRNRVVSFDSLITAAWDESPPPEARTGLHAYVSNLRRLIGGTGLDPRAVLAKAPPGYRLSVPDHACDLGRFVIEKTAGVRAAAAGRFEQASGHLATALAQWRGPVLEDLREFRFVDALSAALLEDKVVAQTIRAESEIACGRTYSVIPELEGLIVDDPFREPLWAQLITAYYLAGRQSDALDAYRRLRLALANDLGIEPGPAIRDLHARILRQEQIDIKRIAMTTAVDVAVALNQLNSVPLPPSRAHLRDAAGRCYPLQALATGIGRLEDNDIVLDDPKVSRHHAVIIDTGADFVINDLHSANGVEVRKKRIRGTGTLTDGDVIRIGDHRLTFEIGPDSAGPSITG